MTYPLIDIARPVRLTEYGKDVFSHHLPFDVKIVRFKPDQIYSINIHMWSFTKDGKYWSGDIDPSIENIPEETKMTVDWTKEIIDLETGEVMRVLCTDAEGSFCVVMMNKNKSIRHSEIDGTVCGKPYYGNRKQDSEPPEAIFKIWYDGFNSRTEGPYNRESEYDAYKDSKTYADYKNKKITVEDV